MEFAAATTTDESRGGSDHLEAEVSAVAMDTTKREGLLSTKHIRIEINFSFSP